jgi:hypothetical protein
MASAEESDGLPTTPGRLVPTISAAIEGVTAIAIILDAEFVFWLVLGTRLPGSGIAVARVAAFGLLSLAIACWPRGTTVGTQAVQALFVYNLLAGFYLGYLRVAGVFAGYLLLPASVLHIVLAVLLVGPVVAAH